MPYLTQKNAQFSNASSVPSPKSSGSTASNGIWSKHRGDVTFDQLQKELLRIDKQTLFEQARKNLYCSRCNGLLLEGFSQIVMYGKSLQEEGAGVHLPNKAGNLKNHINNGLKITSANCQDDTRDPSVHPWGGLATTRDGILTLLDCFLDGKSLEELQNVFDSARARERERELLYPDACGGGGRGWISQGMANYGRGHGTRETCALHTARLSCETLVDFWSALGDETRLSLLRMKEEDFIERLMYRFDSKRFCRDCRRNVIREFKELKELKRMRREPRCTSWFCVADTAFQYEVSSNTVQADWRQSFTETADTYHHFEWAIGTGEGKADILGFEDVGMNGSIQVNGLNLGGLSACFITLRAWKLDGRCTELSVKAHALKGKQCVHRRLVVGDGFVTITKGESIRSFFEHAEEAEEEEDDDSMDKDGNELDGDGSGPQKHAKSPELAREFLLDAATVIFKEQVEKAFREGTARQNAHSIFVCLALKLLEERVHVACKEIITLEKQIKLLEEEEKEKREEEERKERRRTKEREKKLRRKEKLKGKERDRDKNADSKEFSVAQGSKNEWSLSSQEEPLHTVHNPNSGNSVIEQGDTKPGPDVTEEQPSSGCTNSKQPHPKNDSFRHSYNVESELNVRDGNGAFIIEQSKSSRRKLKFRKEPLLDPASKWRGRRGSIVGNDGGGQIEDSEPNSHGYMGNSSRCINGVHRQPRSNISKPNTRIYFPKFSDKFYCSGNRTRDRYDNHSCSCTTHTGYRAKDGYHASVHRSGREIKNANKSESSLDMSRPFYHGNKYNNGCFLSDSCGIPRGKFVTGNITPNRGDFLHAKKVWEPMESRKKCRSNTDPDDNVRSPVNSSPDKHFSPETSGSLANDDSPKYNQGQEVSRKDVGNSGDVRNSCQNGFGPGKSHWYSKDSADGEATLSPILSASNGCGPITSTSSSDNCSSCLSEGDGSTSTLSAHNAESVSTSDSEDASQQSEIREVPSCNENGLDKCLEGPTDSQCNANGETFTGRIATGSNGFEVKFPVDQPAKKPDHSDNGRIGNDMGSQQNHVLPITNQGIHLPVFPAPSVMGYYHQSPASWSAAPTNGLVPFPQPNRYLFANPFGYSLSANQSSRLCMQYGALQQLTPVVAVGQVPFYQTVNKGNGVNSKEQTKNLKVGGIPESEGAQQFGYEAGNLTNISVHEDLPEKPFSNGRLSSEASPPGHDASIGKASKFHHDNPNFSLFHFGGPISVAAGYNLNPVSLKEEILLDFPSNSQENSIKVDVSNAKKEAKEYSLFAASSGTRFSFF